MDKTAIKNFAIEARKTLMKSALSRAGFYGITADEIGAPIQRGADFEIYKTVAGTENRIFGKDIERRRNLVRAIEERGFEQVIEETAYTWFNRLIAIRFMEVNDYLPTRTRVLSSETGNRTPDIVSQYMDLEIGMSNAELEKVQTAVNENRYDDAFQFLFVKQCNALNSILPGLFEKTDDYMELLLDISYTGDGVVRSLVDGIDEANFDVSKEGQVEIIGWMYQYYNTELKDETFAKLKKNTRITKERIPAVTQLFTPDWIVRYMVENSVGRVWIDHLRAVDPTVDEKAKADEFGWKYYLPEAEQEEEVTKRMVEVCKSYKDITPQDITCIDPCMGSGHVLVYMFDVLMDIYRSEGFSEKDAVFDILDRNLFGLDIDQRAYQLSYFALMMKGRGYGGRRFFRGKEKDNCNLVAVEPNVFVIEESNKILRHQLEFYGVGFDEVLKKNALDQMNDFLDSMEDAKEYGSIIKIKQYDWSFFRLFLSKSFGENQISFDGFGALQLKDKILKLVKIGELLTRKYDAVVTNPPYMNSVGMSSKLLDYVKNQYQDSKTDLFGVFIEVCLRLCDSNRLISMITQHSWMFISSFEKLRSIVANYITVNMVHLGARAFDEIAGEVVQTVSFVIRKVKDEAFKGSYVRALDATGEEEKRNVFLQAKQFHDKNVFFNTEGKMYNKIPGRPLVYWGGKNTFIAFDKEKIGDIYTVRNGISTGDNEKYLRLWYEVKNNNLIWKPCNKGGTYRKWYGNNDYYVFWENDGHEIKTTLDDKGRIKARLGGVEYSFEKGIEMSRITSGNLAFRLSDGGFVYESSTNDIYCANEDELLRLLGYCNSKVVANHFLKMLNPTINIMPEDIRKLPYTRGKEPKIVDLIVKENVLISKQDWDSFETSWDFEEHPLVRWSNSLWDATVIDASMQNYYGKYMPFSCSLNLCYLLWQGECNERFNQLRANEEELNRVFIDIYGLQDELTPEVEDKDITVRKADLGRDIRSLISYAVGCMFGRYSLAQKGLIYAGGEFDDRKYGKYPVDEDAIIPITDEAYFDDDIVGRFEEFLSLVFGEADLENNLNFVAEALGTKGKTSREKIRNYFLNDFFKDHCNTYSVTGSGKRPIYWLFDSGKQNGFKALIYMHRYTPDTVGIIRSVYLKKAQDAIEKAMENAEYIMNSDTSAVDKANAKKKHDKYVKQLNELRPYYQALTHVALQKIVIDLDDGVKHNYQLFQGVEISGEGTKNQKIDLLAKI